MLRMEYVTMIPTEVFDCFAQGDYIPLMAQAAMEHALSPRVVDQPFEETADRQYTRDLLFSSVVGLMSLVVCRDLLTLAAELGGQSGQFAPQPRRVARQQPQRNT